MDTDNIAEIIGVVVVLLRVLSDTKVGKKIKIDAVYSLFVKLISYLPVVSEILSFIRKKAEEYEIERLKDTVDRVLPILYIVAENTIKGGTDKKAYVVKELVKYLPKNLNESAVSQLSDYINKSIEVLNFKQKNKEKIENFVERTFPFIPFLFNFITKLFKL